MIIIAIIRDSGADQTAGGGRTTSEKLKRKEKVVTCNNGH